jgi:hypothetical protein
MTMGETLPDKRYGAALRMARLIRGESLREVSLATGVPAWRLTSIERGDALPRLKELAVIWDHLSTDPPPRQARGEDEA